MRGVCMKRMMVLPNVLVGVFLSCCIAYSAPVTVDYTYDDLNRMKDEKGGGNSAAFNYDEVGNITSSAVNKQLVSISITAASTVNARQMKQFSAIGTYQDSSTAAITPTWTSSAPSIASIIPSGMATAVAAGTTNIQASLLGITSPVSVLTVSATPVPINFNSYTISAFGAQDTPGAVATIESSGATLHLKGNAWKKIAFPYAMTAKTVMEFDFQSPFPGDIFAIGLEEDNVESTNRFFELYGTEVWGIPDYKNYVPPSVKHYKIPLGAYYTANKSYLAFANDHDIATPTAESLFSNIKIYEDTQAPTVPTGLTATVISATQINLSWTASTDNIKVAGYQIFRGGVQVGTTTTATTFSNTGLTTNTTYTYTVKAIDASGNVSAASSPVTKTTL